jgi:hypothetical protein
MSESPKDPSTAMPDPQITIVLPLSAWQFVAQCLGKEPFNEVAALVCNIW